MTGRDGMRAAVACALCRAPAGIACAWRCFNHPDQVARLLDEAERIEAGYRVRREPVPQRLELLARARLELTPREQPPVPA